MNDLVASHGVLQEKQKLLLALQQACREIKQREYHGGHEETLEEFLHEISKGEPYDISEDHD